MSLYLVNHSLYRETKRLGENKKPLRSPGDCLQGCRDLCSLIFHCNAISLLGSQSTSQTLMLRFTHGYYLAWVISRAEFRCRYQGRAGLESYWGNVWKGTTSHQRGHDQASVRQSKCAAVQKERLTLSNFNGKEKIRFYVRAMSPSSDRLLWSRAWAWKSSSLSVEGDILGTGIIILLDAAGRWVKGRRGCPGFPNP